MFTTKVKLVLIGILVAAIAIFAYSYHNRGQKIDTLNQDLGESKAQVSQADNQIKDTDRVIKISDQIASKLTLDRQESEQKFDKINDAFNQKIQDALRNPPDETAAPPAAEPVKTKTPAVSDAPVKAKPVKVVPQSPQAPPKAPEMTSIQKAVAEASIDSAWQAYCLAAGSDAEGCK